MNAMDQPAESTAGASPSSSTTEVRPGLVRQRSRTGTDGPMMPAHGPDHGSNSAPSRVNAKVAASQRVTTPSASEAPAPRLIPSLT